MILMTFLLGCDAEPAGCDFPDSATPPSGVLDSSDDCGHWALSLGEHLYLNLAVDSFEVTCSLSAGEGVEEFASPSFSDLGDQGAQWTYDLVATELTQSSEVVISCSDGGGWESLVTVTET